MVLEYIESRALRDLILFREPLLTENVMVFIRQLATVISTFTRAASCTWTSNRKTY